MNKIKRVFNTGCKGGKRELPLFQIFFTIKYKSPQSKKMFDKEFRLEKLASQNVPLVKLKERIDFELFRPLLEDALKGHWQSASP